MHTFKYMQALVPYWWLKGKIGFLIIVKNLLSHGVIVLPVSIVVSEEINSRYNYFSTPILYIPIYSTSMIW